VFCRTNRTRIGTYRALEPQGLSLRKKKTIRVNRSKNLGKARITKRVEIAAAGQMTAAAMTGTVMVRGVKAMAAVMAMEAKMEAMGVIAVEAKVMINRKQGISVPDMLVNY